MVVVCVVVVVVYGVGGCGGWMRAWRGEEAIGLAVARRSEISMRKTNGASPPPPAGDAPCSGEGHSLIATCPKSCSPKAADHPPLPPASGRVHTLIIGWAEKEVPARCGQCHAQRCPARRSNGLCLHPT